MPTQLDPNFFSRIIRLPSGTFDVTGTFNLTQGQVMYGSGEQTVVRLASTGTLINVTGDGAVVRDLRLVFLTASVDNVGISVKASDFMADNVRIDAAYKAVVFQQQSGGVFNRRGTLRKVRQVNTTVTGSTSNCGLELSSVRVLDVVDCQFSNNWRDGIVFLHDVENVNIHGGECSDNGRAKTVGIQDAGSGINFFPGGSRSRVFGTRCDANGFCGISIRTLSGSNSHGPMSNIALVGVACSYNTGSGIAVEGLSDSANGLSVLAGLLTGTQGSWDRPIASNITVVDAVLSNNPIQFGIDGQHVTFKDVVCRAPVGTTTLVSYIGDHARDVTLDNVKQLGGAQSGVYAFVVYSGSADVQILNPTIDGRNHADGRYVRPGDAHSQFDFGVLVLGASTGIGPWTVRNPTWKPNGLFTAPVSTTATTGNLVIDVAGPHDDPNGTYIGAVGSLFRSYGTTASGPRLWTKRYGAVNDATGWVANPYGDDPVAASGSALHWRVLASTSPQVLLSASLLRGHAAVYNHSTASLFLMFSSTPALNDFDVKLTSGAYYELPQPIYRGEVWGVWDVANGWAMVSSLSGTLV